MVGLNGLSAMTKDGIGAAPRALKPHETKEWDVRCMAGDGLGGEV